MLCDEKCEEFSEMISAYIDGELNDAERDYVQQHFETCSVCQSLAADFSMLSPQLHVLYENEVASGGLEERILQQIDSLRTQVQSGVWAWIITSSTGFMAFLTFILFLSPFGLFAWKALNVSSRFGHGLYTVCLQMMSGKQWMILDAVVTGLVVAVTAFLMMSKLIRKTNPHQLGHTM